MLVSAPVEIAGEADAVSVGGAGTPEDGVPEVSGLRARLRHAEQPMAPVAAPVLARARIPTSTVARSDDPSSRALPTPASETPSDAAGDAFTARPPVSRSVPTDARAEIAAAPGARAQRDDGERPDRAPTPPAAVSVEAAAPAARLAVPDHGPERPQAPRPIVEQVVARLSEVRHSGRHEMSLRLDPPDLGGVRIEARLDGTRLQVEIRVDQAPTRELLAEALPRLRESLAQQGFVPDQVSVHLGLEGAGRHPGRDGAPAFTPPPSGEPLPPPRPARPAAPRAARASDGLDLWV
jgi:hypothetical protein